MDRHFLNRFQDTFGGGTFTKEVYLLLAAMLLTILLFWLIWRAINKRKADSKQNDIPNNWVVNAEQIQETLLLALDQRSKMEIRFDHGENLKGRFLIASITSVKPDQIRLEVGSDFQLKKEWLSRKVEVFFKVFEKTKDHPNFYLFSSTIIGIENKGKNQSFISLEVPTVIVLEQKRNHLRIDPPRRFIHGLKLWREVLSSDKKLITNILSWPDELLVIDTFNTRSRVLNISAGGIRLDAYPLELKESEHPFSIGQRYLMQLDLLEPDDDEIIRLYLYCRTHNIYEDFASKAVEVGLQFIASGKKSLSTPDTIHWSKTNPVHGVEAIDNWVFKRHLEFYRDKGMA